MERKQLEILIGGLERSGRKIEFTEQNSPWYLIINVGIGTKNRIQGLANFMSTNPEQPIHLGQPLDPTTLDIIADFICGDIADEEIAYIKGELYGNTQKYIR